MNKHLNIFNFFNSGNLDYLEDNLSRAFALCLKYDYVFLHKILRFVLREDKYAELFGTEQSSCNIDIDLQIRVNELKNFDTIIGVACSGIEIDNFENVIARETNSPETDVCIFVDNICILFEFKKTSEDCAAQLKCQVEKVKQNCAETVNIEYKDLSWNKIVSIILEISSQSETENPFTSDFVRFLETFPHWFPTRLLRNITFPKDESDSNYYYLNNRLNQIKKQIYGEENTKEYSGRFNRLVISVDFGWINEIGIESVEKNNEKLLAIRMHIGDTKQQGGKFFKKNPLGSNLESALKDYYTDISPYIRFSHFNSALVWLRPTIEESKNTHNLRFFDNFAGKHQREVWNKLETVFSENIFDWKNKCHIPNWKGKSDWDEKFEKSNRSHFDLSMGILLEVYLDYEECQQLDETEFNSRLADKIRNVITEIRQSIDGI